MSAPGSRGKQPAGGRSGARHAAREGTLTNCWVELDLARFRENIRSLRSVLTPGTELILVVKANAYGHGLEPAARCGWDSGVRWFAVAHVDEARRLREILPGGEVLVVGVTRPEDVPWLQAHDVISVVVNERHARALAAAARRGARPLRCHAKIDTGMGRLGFAWEAAGDALRRVAACPGLDLQGICTHFASAAAPDSDFAETQMERFQNALDACARAGLSDLFKHVSNSGGVLRQRGWDLTGVRPGILLYGYAPRRRGGGERAPSAGGPELVTRPFLQWKTRVVQVKKVCAGFPISYDSTHVTAHPTCLGTLDVGYADGYSRALSNRGWVIVGGRRRPVVGRVTMNLTVVDLGKDSTIEEGCHATLLGQEGAEAIWADEIAEWLDSIAYEVLTSIRAETRILKGG
jgi:alanine racemase